MQRKNSANLIVRESITHALFKLMQKKPLREITVSELVKTAGVSRNSFYRNFQSLEDILRQYLQDETSNWWEAFSVKPPVHIFREIFTFLLSMKLEINLIYKAGLSHMLMDLFVLCSKDEETDTSDIHTIYKNAANAGALWGLANEWILREMRETPEEMEAIILKER